MHRFPWSLPNHHSALQRLDPHFFLPDRRKSALGTQFSRISMSWTIPTLCASTSNPEFSERDANTRQISSEVKRRIRGLYTSFWTRLDDVTISAHSMVVRALAVYNGCCFSGRVTLAPSRVAES
ncbi:uncharacterized protein ARMOST_15778 [Armillaria ostoyae]|uniref:Uncharacterized protein n=1 Tax=Armillaria ostoyae TaxID=47428 RepID=A0A284RUD9_ARMOS|nr:uncharacterized protein ARMOST_15778 [Armillaria ostoyae]